MSSQFIAIMTGLSIGRVFNSYKKMTTQLQSYNKIGKIKPLMRHFSGQKHEIYIKLTIQILKSVLLFGYYVDYW